MGRGSSKAGGGSANASTGTNTVSANVDVSNIPHFNQNGLLSNDDLQDMLNYIRKDPDRREAFVTSLGDGNDMNAIRSVINDGSVEYFDRYDSDVAEKFIQAYNDNIVVADLKAQNAPVVSLANVSMDIAKKGGEGTFVKTDVPLLQRADGGNVKVTTEAGYATTYKGTTVFIQKTQGGYAHNVYGMNASMTPFKTLKDAKNMDNVKATIDKINNNSSSGFGLETARAMFNAANKKSGISSEELFKISNLNKKKK